MHKKPFEQQNGYAVRSEIAGVIKGLGFTEDEFDKALESYFNRNISKGAVNDRKK